MNIRNILLVVALGMALRADAAMVRVVGVENGRTLVVERGGVREPLTLAGISIVDENAARTLLEWTLASRWVSIEDAPGGRFVYRSPDALFVNRELVLRGYAKATLPDIEPQPTVPVTYLGTLNLPGTRSAAPPRVRAERGDGTSSGKTRRPPTAPQSKRRRGK